MEKKNNEKEYKLSPNEFNILNSIKELIKKNHLKLERNNIILDDIENYEKIGDNIEGILNKLDIEYSLTEVTFLGSHSLIIKAGENCLKVICNIKIIDIIKNKIYKIIN